MKYVLVTFGFLLAMSLVLPVARASGELQIEGAACRPQECDAYLASQQRSYIKARELAEKILKRDGSSYIAHLVLGQVYHYGESNYAKGLFHTERARELYEEVYGEIPSAQDPWRWHAWITAELIMVHGDLEHHAEKLYWIEKFNRSYYPKLYAERAWPLMKMRRFEEARLAAKEAMTTNDSEQTSVALNTLCAVEFEAGNEQASFDACEKAVEYGAQHYGTASSVDLSNLAEAYRSLFKLDQAERVLLEATEVEPSWYGNPWMDLAELYSRGGRLTEAFSALEKAVSYRARRPPHVQLSDRNELRRAVASLLLLSGEERSALEVTETAINRPDRRAHNSRHPAQDLAIVALLDRAAHIALAERIREQASAEPFYKRVWAWLKAQWYEFEGWISGCKAAKHLGDEGDLVGVFQIGTAASAVVAPWLLGDLVSVFGPGVVQSAIKKARKIDDRKAALPYYASIAAEAALEQGKWPEAIELARGAAEQIGAGDNVVRARALAINAEAHRRARAPELAQYYDAALRIDPGVFRRLQWSLPVLLQQAEGPQAGLVFEALRNSPRFNQAKNGLPISIRSNSSEIEICLYGSSRSIIGCSTTAMGNSKEANAWVARAVEDFHQEVFAPRIRLSQMDINSLDGGPGTTRKPWSDDAFAPPGNQLP